MANALTISQRSRLAELEGLIERGLQMVGGALREIRDERLYLETHATFEAYCRERWGYSRAHGYRLIEAAEVAEIVSPVGDIANVAQTRELAPLLRAEGEQAVIEVYRSLVERHGPERVTASLIREDVKKRIQIEDRRATRDRREAQDAEDLRWDRWNERERAIGLYRHENPDATREQAEEVLFGIPAAVPCGHCVKHYWWGWLDSDRGQPPSPPR